MPAVSATQQRLMGMAYAHKKGKLPNASAEVKKVSESMDAETLSHFAKTKHDNLPEKKAAARLWAFWEEPDL